MGFINSGLFSLRIISNESKAFTEYNRKGMSFWIAISSLFFKSLGKSSKINDYSSNAIIFCNVRIVKGKIYGGNNIKYNKA